MTTATIHAPIHTGICALPAAYSTFSGYATITLYAPQTRSILHTGYGYFLGKYTPITDDRDNDILLFSKSKKYA